MLALANSLAADGALGTLLVGDLNVHHLHWLKHSGTAVSSTPAGNELYSFYVPDALAKELRENGVKSNLFILKHDDLEGRKRLVVSIAGLCWIGIAVPSSSGRSSSVCGCVCAPAAL